MDFPRAGEEPDFCMTRPGPNGPWAYARRAIFRELAKDCPSFAAFSNSDSIKSSTSNGSDSSNNSHENHEDVA